MHRSLRTFAAGFAVGALAVAGVSLLRSRPPATLAPTAPPAAGPVRSAPRAGAKTTARTLVASTDGLARLQRWSEGHEPALDRAGALEILRDWSARDPQAALAFVAGARRFPGRTEALALPLAAIGRRDMGAVIAWLQQHQVEADRGRIAAAIIPLIQDADPKRALELAFSEGVPVGINCFISTLDVLVQREPQAALAAFRRLSDIGQHQAAGDLAMAWYLADPSAALTWCRGQSQAPYAGEARLGLLRACVQQGDSAALAGLIRILQPPADELNQLLMRTRGPGIDFAPAIIAALPAEARGEAVQLWAREHLEQSPEETMKLVERSIPPAAQGVVLRFGFESWLVSDRQGAMAWLAAQSSTPAVVELRKLATEDRADSDPVPVLAQLAAEPPDPANVDATTRSLNALAYRDPAGAADWITQHPDKSAPGAASSIMEAYLMRDESGASQWVSTLPKGALQDAALAIAVEHWSERGELQFATDSMNAITDPSARMSAMFQVFSGLAQRDNQAALRWVEEQGLSEETRLTWIAIAKQRR